MERNYGELFAKIPGGNFREISTAILEEIQASFPDGEIPAAPAGTPYKIIAGVFYKIFFQKFLQELL